jgi:HK97 gp10 family phage protein
MADMEIEIVTNIEGLDELEEAFLEGSKRAVKKFLRHVEMKAAKILVDSAERNAPRESGDLSEDIHRQTKQSDGALTVRVGPSRETFYGLIQEFGSLEANIPAQHWLENSARAVQDEVLEEFYSGLTEGLNDMKKGGK